MKLTPMIAATPVPRLRPVVRWIVPIACVSLAGCGGGGGTSEAAVDDNPTNNAAEVMQDGAAVLEGRTITLEANLDGAGPDDAIAWDQVAGPDAFVVEATGNTITLVAPGVDSDTRLTMRARRAAEGSAGLARDIDIELLDRPIVTLDSPPPVNTFIAGNINRYDDREFDDNGIPLLPINGEPVYYPVLIARWAYDNYSDYAASGDERSRERFLNGATWLRDQCIYTDFGFCSYRSYFADPEHFVTDDWPSAMAQGLALSSLIQAHHMTGDDSYARVAQDALAAFQYPTVEKGMQSTLGNGVFYEEYGSATTPDHVLNGFVFALSGVAHYRDTYGDDLSTQVFDRGVATLRDNIARYDYGFTSRYDLAPDLRLASAKTGPDAYHELHIFQLGWLSRLTGEPVFREAAATFLAQDMGGLASIASLRERSTEILEVTASHSIEPGEFGPDRLTDANWTYLRYWSSNRFPVTLDLQINDDILDAGVLDNLVLVSLDDNDFPTSLDLYEVDGSGTASLIRSDISTASTPHTVHAQDIDGYSARVVNFALDVPVSSTRLQLVIQGSANGEYTRLRELDVHYPREALLDEVLGFYDVR